MPQSILEIPEFSDDVVRSIIDEMFHKNELQHDLQEIIRLEQGGDVPQAAPGTIGAASPELMALLSQAADQLGASRLQALTGQAIDTYWSLWQKVQRGKQIDDFGRPPLVHSVPDGDDSLVALTLEALVSNKGNHIRRVMPGGIYIGDVFSSQILYGEKQTSDLFRTVFGPQRDRGGEPTKGTLYRIAIPYRAGAKVSLFLPDDGRHAMVKLDGLNLHNLGVTNGSFGPFSQVATRLFAKVLQEKNIPPDIFTFFYAATLAYEERGSKGRDQLHLREVFDRAINERLGGDFGGGFVFDEKARNNVDTEYDEIMGMIRKFPQNFVCPKQSSLDEFAGNLSGLRSALAKRYAGKEVTPFAEAQVFTFYKGSITSRVLDPDKGVLTAVAVQLVENSQKVMENLYDRIERWLDFFNVQTSQSDVLSDEQFKKLRTDFELIRRYGEVVIPWQAKHTLGSDKYLETLRKVQQYGLADRLYTPDSSAGLPKHDVPFSFLRQVPLALLPDSAKKHEQYVSRGFFSTMNEPTFDLNRFFLLGIGAKAAAAFEHYNAAHAPAQ